MVTIQMMASSVGEKAKVVLSRLLPGIHLPRQQHGVNTGHNSSLTESDSFDKLAKFFIILHSQQQVPCRHSCPLVVPCSVASQLKYLGSQILENSSKVHCSTFTHSSGDASLFQLSQAPANREEYTGASGEGGAHERSCRGHIGQFLAVRQGLASLALLASCLLALLAVGLCSSEGNCRHGRGQHVGSQLDWRAHR